MCPPVKSKRERRWRRGQVCCESTQAVEKDPHSLTPNLGPLQLTVSIPPGASPWTEQGGTLLLTLYTDCACTGHGTCPLGCQTYIKRQTRRFSSFFSSASPKDFPPITPSEIKEKPTPSPWLALEGREGTVRNHKALLLEERVVRCRAVWGTQL